MIESFSPGEKVVRVSEPDEGSAPREGVISVKALTSHSPHPGPLPPGEGVAARRFHFFSGISSTHTSRSFPRKYSKPCERIGAAQAG